MINAVYQNGKQILGFLVIVLIFSMSAGEKPTQIMVLIVLLGMILVNSNEFITFLKDF